jgi:hypothetical protein
MQVSRLCFLSVVLFGGLIDAGQAFAHSGCTVRLGQPGIDFGTTTRGQLLQSPLAGDALSFGQRRVQVHVQCEQVVPLGLEFVAPVADADSFRFGAGTLTARVIGVRVDGRAVQWLNEGRGGASVSNVLRPGDFVVPAVSGATLEGRQMTVEVELEAQVKSAATRVSDVTRFESHGEFRLR